MEPQGFGIVLTTDNVDKLNAFYHDVVGLPPVPELGPSAHNLGSGAILFIQDHTDTKGPAKEPQRYLPGITVADVKAERERMEQQGVRFIRKDGKEEWGGIISTFVDPDGNYIQIMQMG